MGHTRHELVSQNHGLARKMGLRKRVVAGSPQSSRTGTMDRRPNAKKQNTEKDEMVGEKGPKHKKRNEQMVERNASG